MYNHKCSPKSFLTAPRFDTIREQENRKYDLLIYDRSIFGSGWWQGWSMRTFPNPINDGWVGEKRWIVCWRGRIKLQVYVGFSVIAAILPAIDTYQCHKNRFFWRRFLFLLAIDYVKWMSVFVVRVCLFCQKWEGLFCV